MERPEKPRLLAKDPGSGEQGCPSVWVQGGDFIMLGPEEPTGDLANVLAGETAVRLKLDVVREALAKFDRGRP